MNTWHRPRARLSGGCRPAREHVLVSFGGARAGLSCAIAELLDMGSAMVPVHGGVLSAFGNAGGAAGASVVARSRIGLLAEIATEDTKTFQSACRGWLPLQEEGFTAG